MDGSWQRRRFVRGAGSGVALLLAGCTSAADEEGTSTGDDATGTGASTSTPTRSLDHTDETTAREPTPMSTVFHFATDDERSQKHALANVANLLDDESTPTESVVLVANGGGIQLLDRDASAHPDRVAALLDRGVSFLACENSMDAAGTTADDLVDGVETVPAGVGELTKRQTDGYAYIRVP